MNKILLELPPQNMNDLLARAEVELIDGEIGRVLRSIENWKANRNQPRYRMSTSDHRAHCSGQLESLCSMVTTAGQRWNRDLYAMMQARLECVGYLVECRPDKCCGEYNPLMSGSLIVQ